MIETLFSFFMPEWKYYVGAIVIAYLFFKIIDCIVKCKTNKIVITSPETPSVPDDTSPV